jgi:hypothetical protein
MRNRWLAAAGALFLISAGRVVDGGGVEAQAGPTVDQARVVAWSQGPAARVLRCGRGTPGRDSATAFADRPTTLQVVSPGGLPYRLVIPPGALPEPSRRFFLEVTASDTVVVRVWAEGFENGRYGFVPGQRAQLRISANRCSDLAVDTLQNPTIFLLRNGTLIDVGGQPEPGPGNRPNRRSMTTTLDSLSVYIIGTNRG